MSNPNTPESPMRAESGESFGLILSQFERSHAAKAADGLREGTVVSVSSDSVFIDLGLKTEGILPLSEFQNDAAVKPGDKLQVTIKGRDPGGYYLLTRSKAARPTDWAALERAFADKTAIVGTVTGVVKGGLCVYAGVAQRRAGCGRDGELGRAGDPLSHHQARRRGRRCCRRSTHCGGRGRANS